MVQELEKRTRIDVADVLRGLAVMGIIVLLQWNVIQLSLIHI